MEQYFYLEILLKLNSLILSFIDLGKTGCRLGFNLKICPEVLHLASRVSITTSELISPVINQSNVYYKIFSIQNMF